MRKMALAKIGTHYIDFKDWNVEVYSIKSIVILWYHTFDLLYEICVYIYNINDRKSKAVFLLVTIPHKDTYHKNK